MWWLRSGLLYIGHGALVVALLVPLVGLALWLGESSQAALLSSKRGWAMVALVAWKSLAPSMLLGLVLHMAGMFTLRWLRPRWVGISASVGLAAALMVALRFRDLGWPMIAFLAVIYCAQAAWIGRQLRKGAFPRSQPHGQKQ